MVKLNRIREIRRVFGAISLRDLADVLTARGCNITWATLNNVEIERSKLLPEYLDAISSFYNVSPEYLMGGIPKTKQEKIIEAMIEIQTQYINEVDKVHDGRNSSKMQQIKIKN